MHRIRARVFQCLRDTENVLIKNPPHESHELGPLLPPFIDRIPDINALIDHQFEHHTAVFMSEMLAGRVEHDFAFVYRKLEKIYDCLFYTLLCDNFSSFADVVQMNIEKPCSGAMVLYLSAAYIHVLLSDTDARLRLGLVRSGVPPSDTVVDKKATDYLYVKKSLIAACTEPIGTYTARQLLSAIQLLSSRWYSLAPTGELVQYMHDLLKRSFQLSVTPKRAKVHDYPAMRVSAGTVRGEEMFSGNADFMRRVVEGLVRMISVARWRTEIVERVPYNHFYASEHELVDACSRVRTGMIREIDRVKGINTIKAELKDMFYTSGMTFGDLAIFREKSSMDQARPINVIFDAKGQSVQRAWSSVNDLILVEGLVRLDENAPFYWKTITFAMHLYSQNVKMYAAEMLCKSHDIKLISDYCVAEQHFIGMRKKMQTCGAPIILQNFGRLHVVHGNRLYECISAEHAVATWAMVLRHECGSEIVRGDGEVINVAEVVANILNEQRVYAETDVWRGTTLIEGDITD